MGIKWNYRVKAKIGYITWISLVEIGFIFDAESDWSNIQTLTIPGRTWATPPPSQTTLPIPTTSDGNGNQSQSPEQIPSLKSVLTNQLLLLSIGLLFCCILVVVIMALRKRQLKTSDYKTR
jgi:hypothetical protein